MTKKAHILIVAPHTDDAEFGISGTVAKWAREGKNVAYVICTNGNKGTSDLKLTTEELAKMREQEQREAAKLLGVREVVFLGYPDQGLEDSSEFRKEVVRWIRTFKPDIVATPDPYRRYIWHRDHRICGQVTLDAVYPYARDHLAYPDLFAEGLKPHSVKEVWCWGTEDPNHWTDIADVFDIKLAALRCHRSQLGHRFSEVEQRVRQRATDSARGSSFKLAEAFHRVEIWM
ncbi:MAG: PIG-L deacetylase family protein [Dehalococcoidia bacterium]|nr:PIG-L deacetylase family protein [Dehalococcoidia bacterium]